MATVRANDNLKFVVVDVETSGGHPHESRITEISMQVTNGSDIISSYTTLINPTVGIPPYVRRLTGITNEMTDSAPLFRQVAKDILKIMQNCVFVAHNVSFDYSVLRSEFKRIGIEWESEQLCTIKASKKIVSGLPSYSLGKLAESLSIKIENRHRAEGDARATAEVLHHLFKADPEAIQGLINKGRDEFAIYEKYAHLELHGIPHKTGLIMIFDIKGKPKFVRAVSNLRKHVIKYLKAREKMKNVFEIGRIEHKVTGSHLLARIYEKEKKYEWFTQEDIEFPVPKKFKDRSYLIIDRGPSSDEKSILLVENGKLVRYGILSNEEPVSGIDEIRERLQPSRNPAFAQIVTEYLVKNKVEKLEFLKT